MKQYNGFRHISDVWDAFEKCSTLNDVEKLIDLIPKVFGDFRYEIINPETVRIINERYDKSLDQYDTEQVDFDVDVTFKH